MRVLVAEDREIVRIGLRTVLAAHDDLDLVGEATSVSEVGDLARRVAPDVIVLDAHLADGHGIAATRELLAIDPAARVIVFTDVDDDASLFGAIDAGASGLLLKRVSADELVTAIRHVAGGQSLLDPAVTASVLQRLRQQRTVPTDERLSRLSPRELEILTLVADGRSNQQIATVTYLSEKTVKNHLTRIMNKLGVRRRTEAAAYFSRLTARYPA